jgi:hypothetical protein
MVDKHTAQMSGMAGFVDKGKPRSKPSGISIPKLGSKMKFPQQGRKSK